MEYSRREGGGSPAAAAADPKLSKQSIPIPLHASAKVGLHSEEARISRSRLQKLHLPKKNCRVLQRKNW